ncbi:MAG: cell division protein SepF [Armatimonadota bacterium]|jgi:cell division inhibitor SepF|nr:cell division protein SepF [Armatimonadota bacterium]
MMNEEMSTDEYRQRGLWTRIKEGFGISELEEEYDDAEDVAAADTRKRPITLRLHSARMSYVSVRIPLTFDDARLAADGLKDGRQQIINLEKTTPEMSERIIDFLSGVTYALNGFVEKVGDRVYLFAPSNVSIDMPDDLHKASPSLLFDGSKF